MATAVTAEQLLAKRDLPPVEVSLGDLGSVWIRRVSADERTEIDLLIRENPQRMRALVVSRCACNDRGEPLFEKTDAAAIGTIDACILEPIVDACLEALGMREGDLIDQANTAGN